MPTLSRTPSDSDAESAESHRRSLYDAREEFIHRLAPNAMAAIFFGHFSLAPQDGALSRQALFKLSFLHRHFLKPGGLSVLVRRQSAIFSGEVKSRPLVQLAELLANQIEGLTTVKDETVVAPRGVMEELRERVLLLLATDQTLRSGVRVEVRERELVLSGQTPTARQRTWAEQLARSAGAELISEIAIATVLNATEAATQPPDIDNESLQALVHFRLQLVRETEHLAVKVKAARGVVTLQGKVRTEPLRQRAENIARSTLGLRELRSTLTVG